MIDALTERQRAVIKGICEGKRNAEIGLELAISPQTVKNHVTIIFARTGPHDRARVAYLYAKWEEVQRSTFSGSQIDVQMNGGATLSFRIFAPNRLLIRVGRSDGPIDLFELSEEESRALRGLLLADVAEETDALDDGAEDYPTIGRGEAVRTS